MPSPAPDVATLQAEVQRLRQYLAGVDGVAAIRHVLLTARHPDRAFRTLLEQLGTALRADRAYLLRYQPAAAHPLLLHEETWYWSRAAVPPATAQATPRNTLLAALTEALAQGQPFRRAADEVPPPLQALFQAAQMFALLMIPVRLDASCWGVLVLERSQQQRWSPQDEATVQTVAADLATYITQQRQEATYIKQAWLLRGVGEAVSQLIATENLAAAIEEALKVLGRTTGADQVAIFQQVPSVQPSLARLRYTWENPTAQPSLPELPPEVLLTALDEHLYGRLADSWVVRKTLDWETRPLQRVFVPILMKQALWGFLCFEAQRAETDWLAEEESILVAAAFHFGSVVARMEAQQALAQQSRLLQSVVRTASHLSSEAAFHEVVPTVLETIGRSAWVDHVHLAALKPGGVTIPFAWTHPEATHLEQEDPAQWYTSLLPHLQETLATEPVVRLIVPGRPSDQENPLARANPRSALLVPIRLDGQLWGCVAFFDRYAERTWDEEEHGLVAMALSLSSALARARARTRTEEQAALLDEARYAIYVWAMDDTITFWNRSAEQLYGWNASEVVGHPADQVHFRKTTSEIISAYQTALLEGAWSGELEQRDKHDERVMVESTWTLIRDAFGNPKSILIAETDVTEKKQLEEQVLRAQRMDSIGTLAGGIAHDINNVLGPILIAADLLHNRTDDAFFRRKLENIQQSARRGADIVKQILAFARGTGGERTPIQPRHIFKDAIAFAEETLPKSIKVEQHLPRDLWLIHADPTQLHQVLLNLSVNARDAMPNGGTLTVRAENRLLDEEAAAATDPLAEAGAYVVVTVSDTGTGIPKDILDKIFDPFFTTKARGKGTGLGLSTVITIVKSHGGFLQVASELDEGTTFLLYLPALTSEDEKEQAVAEVPGELLVGEGECILVVDDEAMMLESTKDMLESVGYRVLTATNGGEAVNLFVDRQHEIDLILTDINMPNMDGLQLINVVRNIAPEQPFIVASGMLEAQQNPEERGFADVTFLAKPFEPHALLQIVRHTLCPDQVPATPPSHAAPTGFPQVWSDFSHTEPSSVPPPRPAPTDDLFDDDFDWSE